MSLAIDNAKDAPAVTSKQGDVRWKAVVERDAAFDGAFVYSVRTTGVYCRPSCPSRLAKPENVAFHATCEAAERAGYRACRRCRPNAPSLASRRAAAVAEACRAIEDLEEPPSLQILAGTVGMSPYHFHRVFKAATGLTPRLMPPRAGRRACATSWRREPPA